MKDVKIKDKKNFICDPYYREVMNQDEKLYWSGDSYKINYWGKW